MSDATELQDLLDKGARFYAAGQSVAAAGLYRQALKIAPDDPTVRLRHALAIWHGENRAEEALAEVQALAAKYPQAAVHGAAALILNSLGRFGDGATAARKAVVADPGHSSSWLDLATAIDASDAPALENELGELLGREGWSDPQRRYLHYARALTLRKQDRPAEAFDETGRGNALSPKRWKAETEKKHHGLLRAVFTQELLERIETSGHDDARMIFIFGMPRSGTTLLERMLTAHPKVGSVGETPLVGNLFGQLQKQSGGHPAQTRQALNGDVLKAIGAAYLKGVEGRLPGGAPPRIIDKMPGNYLFAPLIASVFPNATLIHMRRHPLDTCLSCWEASFSYGLDYANDLTTLGQAYRLYADLTDHWEDLLGERILTVRYESLVESPEQTVRPILKAAGLGWHPACVSPSGDGPIKTASVAQARSEVTTRSAGRWIRFADQLIPTIEAMGGLIWAQARAGQTDGQPSGGRKT